MKKILIMSLLMQSTFCAAMNMPFKNTTLQKMKMTPCQKRAAEQFEKVVINIKNESYSPPFYLKEMHHLLYLNTDNIFEISILPLIVKKTPEKKKLVTLQSSLAFPSSKGNWNQSKNSIKLELNSKLYIEYRKFNPRNTSADFPLNLLGSILWIATLFENNKPIRAFTWCEQGAPQQYHTETTQLPAIAPQIREAFAYTCGFDDGAFHEKLLKSCPPEVITEAMLRNAFPNFFDFELNQNQ